MVSLAVWGAAGIWSRAISSSYSLARYEGDTCWFSVTAIAWINCSNGLFSSVWVTTGIRLGVMRRSWRLLVDGRSGDVVVGGALDDMVVVVSVISLKGNVWFCDLLASTFCCSLWRGDEGSPKKTERNDFFSCGRGLLMLTGRRYQKTSSPLAEGKKLTAAASHENFSRTLNGYDFCTNQLILYDLSAILPC